MVTVSFRSPLAIRQSLEFETLLARQLAARKSALEGVVERNERVETVASRISFFEWSNGAVVGVVIVHFPLGNVTLVVRLSCRAW